MVFRVDTAPHGLEPPTPLWLIADWLGLAKPPAPGEYTIPSSEQNALHLRLNESGTKAVILPDDTAPHGVESPTAGFTFVGWSS